jgi:nucleotide-binding universal stress UspA family protein
MYQRILVPTDGSDLSGKAVRSAIVLYVAPRYPVSYFEGGLPTARDDVARIEKQWTDKGQATVDAATQAAAQSGVKARGLVVQSDLVAESIQAIVEKDHCDLVVMASHGRKGLSRLLLGSETQHVLTHGKVPVLVLR